MIAEWLKDWQVWFQSPTNMAWFISFWLCAGCLFSLELVVPAFESKPERRNRWPTNFGFGVVNSWIMAIVPLSTITASEWASRSGVGLLNQIASPIWFKVGCTLALYSLASYFIHVMAHKIPWLWRIHRVHHSDTHLDVSTSQRHHPLELVLNLVFLGAVTIAFGLNSWVLIFYAVMESFINFFSHANIRLAERVDRFLRWVFITPNMHCLHHSSYQPETDSNYGAVFTVWDRLFGTYRADPASSFAKLQIGLKEIRDDRAWRFWWQMKSPALTFKSAMRSEGES